MKRLLIYALVVMFGVLVFGTGQLYAQYPEAGWWMRESELMIGEHVPIVYSGSGVISATNAGKYYTQWMFIGYDPAETSANNKEIVRFNPEYFTGTLRLTTSGDSASCSDAKIQFANTIADTIVVVTMTVAEGDTSVVGQVITGSTSAATAIITSVTAGTGGKDTIIVANMYPGDIFIVGDNVGNGGGEAISVVTYSNTGVICLADSSNIFIDAGVYSHVQYGTWRFLPQVRTDISVQYAIRVFGAAWCRLVFEDVTVADNTTVNWKFRVEH